MARDATQQRPLDAGYSPSPVIEVQAREFTFRLPAGAADAPAFDNAGAVPLAAELARTIIGREVVECGIAVFTDARDDILGFAHIARGSLNRAFMPPCDVLRPALLVGASGVVVAHNHPSGDAQPSWADRVHLDRVSLAADLIGLRVLGAVVVTVRCWRRVAPPAAWSDVPAGPDQNTTHTPVRGFLQ